MNECCICAQIAGNADSDLLHHLLGGQYQRRVLRVDDRFAVMPSVGALSACHVLLCPTEHVRSFAALDTTQRGAAIAAAAKVEEILLEKWGRPTHLFEHGNATTGTSVACSVEHAHLHFVTSERDVWDEVKDALNWRNANDADEALSLAGGNEYLRYRDPTGRWRIAITETTTLPSQLMRRAFAHVNDEPTMWNWRTHPRRDRLRKIWRELSTA